MVFKVRNNKAEGRMKTDRKMKGRERKDRTQNQNFFNFRREIQEVEVVVVGAGV